MSAPIAATDQPVRTLVIIAGPTRAAVQAAITEQMNKVENAEGCGSATFCNPYMIHGGTWCSEGVVITEPAEAAE